MKSIKYLLLTCVFILFSTSLSGQVYPAFVIVGWDKNPDIEQIIDYTLIHNNGFGNQSYTILHSSCTFPIADGQCQHKLAIPSAVMQSVSVTARNVWGTSAPENLTFSVTAPGKPKNIKIKIAN